jgi:Dimethlysulfonioproprionate lyase
MPSDRTLAEARDLLRTPIGIKGSARQRYSAAMTLYQAGYIDAEVLEVYRSCASLDGQNPEVFITEYGLRSPLEPEPSATARTAIAALITAFDHYLSTMSGPGIAEVRERIAEARHRTIVPQTVTANPVAATYLSATLNAAQTTVPALADAIRKATPYLRWNTYDAYDPHLIGTDFPQNHAFTSILGTDAPICADNFDLGLFLIAPHVLYRDHKHLAPELYAPITGPHGWRFGPDAPLHILPAHQPIWNEPNAPHLTKVGPVPFLCVFAWTRDANAIAEVVPAIDWAALEALRIAGD